MAEEKKKSRVDDINRSVYDIKDEVEFSYKADRGLTEDIIRKISTERKSPHGCWESVFRRSVFMSLSTCRPGARYF